MTAPLDRSDSTVMNEFVIVPLSDTSRVWKKEDVGPLSAKIVESEDKPQRPDFDGQPAGRSTDRSVVDESLLDARHWEQ